jgi:hypothetical protein
MVFEGREKMKCDSCKFKTGYVLGPDECGAGNWLAYCSKGHWSGCEEPEPHEDITCWDKCKDFLTQ